MADQQSEQAILNAVFDATNQVLKTSTTVTADIQIGQVELKDADSTAEANIKAANTARTTGTVVVATQTIDAAGNVLGKTAVNTARTTATLVDPVQLVDAAGNVVNVTAANTARTTGTLVLPTQPIDAAGAVLGKDAANTARTTATLVAPSQIVDPAGNVLYAGPVALSGLFPSSDVSAAYEASSVSKASAGAFFSMVGYNSRTSTQFIQVFNSATVPADTAVPVFTFAVPASSNFSLDIPKGHWFSTGISWSNSSTGPTKTLGSADVFAVLEYI